jgi:hypothetical protein
MSVPKIMKSVKLRKIFWTTFKCSIERRKLFPAQQKNREEFHEILEDIGMVTQKT